MNDMEALEEIAENRRFGTMSEKRSANRLRAVAKNRRMGAGKQPQPKWKKQLQSYNGNKGKKL